MMRDFLRLINQLTQPDQDTNFLGAIVDIPKYKRSKKNIPEPEKLIRQITTKENLQEVMSKGRTPEEAKKKNLGLFLERSAEE